MVRDYEELETNNRKYSGCSNAFPKPSNFNSALNICDGWNPGAQFTKGVLFKVMKVSS